MQALKVNRTPGFLVNGSPLRDFGESQQKLLVEQERKKAGAPCRRCCTSPICCSGFGLSDLAMEEALHDTPLLREFGKLDVGIVRLPDETTMLRFLHLGDHRRAGHAAADSRETTQAASATRRRSRLTLPHGLETPPRRRHSGRHRRALEARFRALRRHCQCGVRPRHTGGGARGAPPDLPVPCWLASRGWRPHRAVGALEFEAVSPRWVSRRCAA